MGKYDALDKAYFGTPERLAELISQGIHHGKLQILSEDLDILPRKYPSLRTDGGEYERDGICFCRKYDVKYGIEIELYADQSMPRRILTYDACEYEKEAKEIKMKHKKAKELDGFEELKSGMKAEDEHYAIVNCVLYLGRGRYRGGRDMREYINGERLHPLIAEKVQNYSFIVIEADYVNPEEYQTELKLVFEALQTRGDKQRMKKLFQEDRFQHMSRETQKIIAVHLNQKDIIKKVVEEGEDMCKAMRDWAREERAIGRKEGKKEGREEGRIQGNKEALKSSIHNLMETFHLSIEQAMDALRIPESDRAIYRN